MKIKATMPTLLTDGAIFKHLTILEDLNMTASQLGLKYFFRSGEKTANSLIEHFCTNGVLDETAIGTVGHLIDDYYKDDWTRINDALTVEYNPIENYDRIEDSEVSHAGTDTDIYGQQSNTLGERVGNSSHSLSPYDSITLKLESGDSWTELSHSDTFGSHTDTHQRGTSDTTESRIHGNVGVTTNQKMIGEELELRKNNMISRIMSDVDRFIALKVYE